MLGFNNVVYLYCFNYCVYMSNIYNNINLYIFIVFISNITRTKNTNTKISTMWQRVLVWQNSEWSNNNFLRVIFCFMSIFNNKMFLYKCLP